MVKGISCGSTRESPWRDFLLNTLGSAAQKPENASDERWALVQRVVSSRIFHKSARQREFLLYIAQCLVTNRLDDITEQAIGRHVFGRTAGYEPSEDNIVRVAARQLRIKLREYFDTEGEAETLIVEIPKGGYVPVFHPREAAVQNVAVPAPVATTSARSHIWRWSLGAVLAALVAGCGFLWLQNRELKRELRAKEAAPNALMSAVRGTASQRLTVVLADSTFGILVNTLGRNTSLDDYVARRFPEFPEVGNWAGARDFFNRLLQNKLTSIADAELASRIVRSAGEHHVDARLRQARDVIVRDFHSDNLVIIGGPRTNPWTQLLESSLNFRFEIAPQTSLREIVNQAPRAGENRRYSDESPGPGTSYARVAVVPNLAKSGKVILIGGTKTAATEAAGDYVLSPSALGGIASALGTADLSQLESFELLLESSQLAGTPSQTKLLSWRAGKAREH